MKTFKTSFLLQIYLVIGILLIGFLSGRWSRSSYGGASTGGLWLMLIFSLGSIFFGLPLSFLLPPLMAALPLSDRHPLLYHGYWALLAGSFVWFVLDLFGSLSLLEAILYLTLLSLGWLASFLSVRHYSEHYGNPALPIASALLLLQQLAVQLEMDLPAEVLLLVAALGMLGFSLGAEALFRWSDGGMRFFAFFYIGMALLIAEDIQDLLKVAFFLLPFWVLMIAEARGVRFPLLQRTGNPIQVLLIPLLQFWFGFALLQLDHLLITIGLMIFIIVLTLWLSEQRRKTE